MMQSKEDEAARQRITADLPVREAMRRLADNGITVWSMPIDGLGHVLMFVGPAAPDLSSKAFAACYPHATPPPPSKRKRFP